MPQVRACKEREEGELNEDTVDTLDLNLLLRKQRQNLKEFQKALQKGFDLVVRAPPFA